ncbi:MAG: sn-glycerol-3-phosphate ABC transporter substrate-binding protein UgpB [Burkholderiaceae bacterium]
MIVIRSIRFRVAGLAVAGAAALVAGPAWAQTEIQWWHAMTGALGDRVGSFADRFNKSQSEYRVVPVFKGSYPETMAAAIAAYRAGNAPHIVQIFEVGTATMMSAKGAIIPVEKMMKEVGERFDRNAYVPAVAGYYTSRKGEMLSFPFNSSTTVFYYNRDALAKAGVARPPETWPEVAAAAAKIKAAGATPCAFTTGWQSWTQIESFSAWHNVPMATANNGFDSTSVKLLVNSPLHVRHIGNLAQWSKDGLFSYGGRRNEPEAKFYSGECAMLTSSSAAYANIKRNAKFAFGIGKLPYYSDVDGAPQNTVIGGASLWVMAGRKRDEYRGVARFFTFLSSPQIQAEWHQETGYLPLTRAAYELTRQSGFYDKNPGTDVAVEQMIVKTTDKSRGIRLGNFVQIRDIIDEELEGVWGGKQDARTALDRIVKRGNEQLSRFERTAKD